MEHSAVEPTECAVRGDEADRSVRALARTVAVGARSRRGTIRRRSADRARASLLDRAQGSIRSVVADADRHRSRVGVDREDLYQEACAAVYEAAASWDPDSYPSWTAYAGRAASRALANWLDRYDELGRSMTRSSARMRRHVRGVRAGAEAEGRTLAAGDLISEVHEAVGWQGGHGPGDDALVKDGTARSLLEDLPTMVVETPVVWLDAPVGDEDGTSTGELHGVCDREGAASVLGDLAVVLDEADLSAALDGQTGAGDRLRSQMTAPHFQWAALAVLDINAAGG